MTKDLLFKYYCVPLLCLSVVFCLVFLPKYIYLLMEYPLLFQPITPFLLAFIPWVIVDQFDLLPSDDNSI